MEDNRIALDFDSNLFEKIKPAFRYDGKESMESWQNRAYKRLWELLGLDRMEKPKDDKFSTEPEFEVYGIKVIAFSFQSEEGYFVPGYITLPKDHKGEKLPLCICLQGHSTGMHNSVYMNYDRTPMTEESKDYVADGDRGFCNRAVKEGYVAVCIEQRYMGLTGTYKEKPGCSGLQSMASLLMGRSGIGCRVWDVMRTIDALEKNLDYVDTENTVCMGNSGGGTATFYASCIEKRIKYSMPSCAFCTYKDSIVDIRHCACNYIPGIALDFDMGDLAGLIAPRNLVIVNGAVDKIFPEFGVKKAFDVAKTAFDAFGGKIELVTGDGGHRFYADDAWPVLHRLEKENGIVR
jgi:dienelactone hydrolase